MKEEWKQVTGFEDYQVSNLGRIYSKITIKILKTYINNNRYECISLYRDFKRHRFIVHRLVAKEFCSGYKEGLVVNHKDANRLNNQADNLEWVTTQENTHDMQRRGTMDTYSARQANRKNLVKKVDMYTPDGSTYIKTFDTLKEAGKAVGLKQTSKITEVVKGRRPRAGGYHWKYNDPKDNYSYYRKGMR